MRGTVLPILAGALLAVGCAGSSTPRSAPVRAQARAPLAASVPSVAGADAGADAEVRIAERAPQSVLELAPRPKERDLVGEPASEGITTDLGPLVVATSARGIAQRPPRCAAYADRPPAKDTPQSLGAAVAVTDPAKRDAMLVALRDTSPVLVAALRAELAPIECADAITDAQLLGGSFASGRAAHVLVGLSLASKLARTSSPEAIDALKTATTSLHGYAWALALLEAGLADLRAHDAGFVDRKTLGRDGILTAFAELAKVGVLRNRSMSTARARLAALFPSQRVDTLDELLLPSWTPPAPADAAEGVLAKVSAYWFSAYPTTFKYVRSTLPALAMGVPNRHCHHEGCEHYARARLDLGRTYWRRVDFVEAAHAVKEADLPVYSGTTKQLLLALARDLANGPLDAADMMAHGGAVKGFDRTEALDAVAAEGTRVSGMAAYDAAHLRSLCVPDDASAVAHLNDVADRFERASAMLEAPAHRRLALDRARASRAAAAAKTAELASTRRD